MKLQKLFLPLFIFTTLPLLPLEVSHPTWFTQSYATQQNAQNTVKDSNSQTFEKAPELNLPASSAILMDAHSGQTLYDKNADVALPPASITKIMTLLLAFDELSSGRVQWDDLVAVSERAWSMGGSQMFLNIGQEVTYGELITGISVVSANDACVAIAEHIAGSEDAFVREMNDKAKELGLSKTMFRNSNGLPAEGHVMSARDIANLAQHLIKTHPKILELESMTEFKFNDILQYNRNPLLGNFEGADGLKTGWTEEAGYCLVGTAQQNDLRLISVVLGTENDTQRLAASRTLLNHGFRNFKFDKVITKNQYIDTIPIEKAKEKTVDIQTQSDLKAIVPNTKTLNITKDIKINENLVAPIPAGEVIGQITISIDGKQMGSVDLVTKTEVTKVGFFTALFRMILRLFGIGV